MREADRELSEASIGAGFGAADQDTVNEAPILNWIVAASYRCGSTFFCSQLWRTGVLGAPGEYLNVGEGRRLRDVMMRRLRVASPEGYFAKLLGCRTSKNGIFGMKVHFPHFVAAVSWYPSLIAALSPLTFIYLDRRDKLAQAVSMARAMQSDAWSSMDGEFEVPLTYDEASIAQCLREIQHQTLGWRRWFDANHIQPFVLYYEDAVADTAGAVRSVVELLGVQGDEPEEIHLPPIERQSDETNAEWVERFRRERDRCTELDGGYAGGVFGWES